MGRWFSQRRVSGPRRAVCPWQEVACMVERSATEPVSSLANGCTRCCSRPEAASPTGARLGGPASSDARQGELRGGGRARHRRRYRVRGPGRSGRLQARNRARYRRRGGVGRAAVQIAAAVGARVVAVASPPTMISCSAWVSARSSTITPPIRLSRCAPWFLAESTYCSTALTARPRPGPRRGHDGGRAISIVLQSAPLQLERGITGESFAAHGGRPA